MKSSTFTQIYSHTRTHTRSAASIVLRLKRWKWFKIRRENSLAENIQSRDDNLGFFLICCCYFIVLFRNASADGWNLTARKNRKNHWWTVSPNCVGCTISRGTGKAKNKALEKRENRERQKNTNEKESTTRRRIRGTCYIVFCIVFSSCGKRHIRDIARKRKRKTTMQKLLYNRSMYWMPNDVKTKSQTRTKKSQHCHTRTHTHKHNHPRTKSS